MTISLSWMLQVGHPREHAWSAGAGESGHRIAANSSGCFGVAGAVLNHAAT
jgi:hypothetical protein